MGFKDKLTKMFTKSDPYEDSQMAVSKSNARKKKSERYYNQVSQTQHDKVRLMEKAKHKIAEAEKRNAQFDGDFFAKFEKVGNHYETSERYQNRQEVSIVDGRKAIVEKVDDTHHYFLLESGKTVKKSNSEVEVSKGNDPVQKMIDKGKNMEVASAFVVESLYAAKETYPKMSHNQLNYLQHHYQQFEIKAKEKGVEKAQEQALRSFVTQGQSDLFSPLTKAVHDVTSAIVKEPNGEMLKKIQAIETTEYLIKKPGTEIGKAAKTYETLVTHTSEKRNLKRQAEEWAKEPSSTIADFKKGVLKEKEKTTQKQLER